MDDAPRTAAPASSTDAEHEISGVASELLGRDVAAVSLLGRGTDHHTYAVDETLVLRLPQEPGQGHDVEAEARLLAHIAPLVPLAVPEVIAADATTGAVVMTRIPGSPLLGHPTARPSGADLRPLLLALHEATEGVSSAGLAEPDPYPLSSYLEEASGSVDRLASLLTRSHGDRLRRFVEQPPPPEPELVCFGHNDLGAEHLFADSTGRLTGVIDWSDAALVDPARDLGRLYRDLGPDVAADVLAGLPYRDDDHIWRRVRIHAVCSLVEDLEFGAEHDERYARAALAHLDRTLDPAAARI